MPEVPISSLRWASRLQHFQPVPHFIARNGKIDAGDDPVAKLLVAAGVDADDLSVTVNERSAAVSWVDVRIDLNVTGVFTDTLGG